MTEKMKVYGASVGLCRRIVAAPTQKAAAAALNMSRYSFNLYACETGNEREIRIAMLAPGEAFISDDNAGPAPFRKAAHFCELCQRAAAYRCGHCKRYYCGPHRKENEGFSCVDSNDVLAKSDYYQRIDRKSYD